jgi:hypothetical protein
MKKSIRTIIILLVVLNRGMAFGNEAVKDSSITFREYSFTVFPGTLSLFTMEQMDEDYLSTSRLLNRSIETVIDGKNIWKIPIASLINFTWPLFTMAITHEEGHRSILTNQGIGAISCPFYSAQGTAGVYGVTDSTLKGLRSRDLSSFIRMYTAGMESDYMMARRSEQLAAFNMDTVSVLYPDFLMRVAMTAGYEELAVFYQGSEEGLKFCDLFVQNLSEENNELERDIVGMDTFGAVHWMFYPNAEYKRYVQWSDLTSEEKRFLWDRMWRKSYCNFLSPFLFMKPYFRLSDEMTITGSAGYCLAPFGDFIDENVYFTYRKFHISFYAREYENYDTWFPAFGVSLCDYKPLDWLSFTVSGHFWMEPENLGFYATTGVPGGAVKIKASIFVPFTTTVRAVSIDMSILYKTAGYLPEVESHKQLFRVTCGTTVRF